MLPSEELLQSIDIIAQNAAKNGVKIYTAIVTSVGDNNTCSVHVNGKTHSNIAYYGDVPTVNKSYRVFCPNGSMNQAFIITGGGSSGGGSTGTTDYNQLANRPSINGTTLSGNQTSSQLGLYGTNNVPPYPVTSVNGQTGNVVISTGGNVDSVNGKTGVVVLNKSDVGLGNVDNVRQYSTSNPPPYPVQSVDGATGAVVTNAVKTTPQSLSDTQKQQVRTNIGAGTSNFSGSYDDLSNKPTIPDPYTLPVANSTTLGGVKPVAKTSNMTQSVGVDVNGALYTAPGGGGTGSGDMLKSVYDATGTVEQAGGIPDYVANNAPVTSVNGKTGVVAVHEVPTVTTSDNGKFLRVVNGAWAAVAIADANGVKF